MNPADSFRDPAGYVSVTDDRVIRTVYPDGAPNLRACLNSPAARRFVEAGSLIATVMADSAPLPGSDENASTAAPVVVEHPRIPFISYPHEWPPAMLHAAGRLTLDLCEALLEEGLGLKDATPSNVLFRGPNPVFIDVLSIEQRGELDPIWLADAQFARTFLIPLLLNRRTGYALSELFLSRRDGVPPVEAVHRLPGFRRWFPPDAGLVTLPARASRLEGDDLYRPRQTRDAGEARFVLGHHFRALRKKLEALQPGSAAAPSASVPDSGEPATARRTCLGQWLRETGARRVLDAASGAGEWSLEAAAAGALVVAIDRNPEAAASLWRAAVKAQADILPLVVDFARPTPAAGWRCREHLSFLDRAQGFFDAALLLDSLHHFMVGDQIPPQEILDALASVTSRWLFIEYVGPGDPVFHRLARGRDALYAAWDRPAFEACARRRFEIVSSLDLPSADRALYLLRRSA